MDFFFQAEDGIRGHCVTGVQTCALPISIPLPMVSIISGRLAADSRLDIQDVMAVPTEARSFSAALEHAWSLHQAIGEQIGRASCRERVEMLVVAGASQE